MASLRQLYRDYVKKPLWELRAEPESKVEKGEKYNIYSPEHQQQSGKFSLEDLRETFEREPMIAKGIRKKNKDIFREGWQIAHKDPDKEVNDRDLDIIEEFDRQAKTAAKLESGFVCSDIYGSGFVEEIYEEKKTNTIDMPILPKALPVNLKVLNSEYIVSKEKDRTKSDDKTVYFIYWKHGMGKKYMHPARIIHVVKDKLPNNDFGISRIYNCRQILSSKMKGDKQYGEIVTRFGSGKIDVLDKASDPTRKKDILKTLQDYPDLMYHDDNLELKEMNFNTIRPKEFHDIFTMNIAAALEMPQHILIGVQPGQTKGSELGIADYYNDVMNAQELILTPILERLYGQLLKANGRNFDDYRIRYNPIFIDETSEAEIGRIRSEIVKNLMELFIIEDEDAIAIMEHGLTDSEGKFVIKPKEEEPEEPPETPKKPEVPVEEVRIRPLTPAQKKHIELTKALLETEKIKGKLELEEQERRLKAAKKAKK